MTPNDLLTSIMTYVNQYKSSGIQSNTTVDTYEARIPILCNDVQSEIITKCKPLTSYKITLTAIGDEGFRAITLPDNFMLIRKVIDDDGRNRVGDDEFIYIEGNLLYVLNSYTGSLNILYLAFGNIESLDNEFIIPIVFKNAVIYYVVAMLLFDQNTGKASFFQQKYEEQLALLTQTEVKRFKKVTDSYA